MIISFKQCLFEGFGHNVEGGAGSADSVCMQPISFLSPNNMKKQNYVFRSLAWLLGY